MTRAEPQRVRGKRCADLRSDLRVPVEPDAPVRGKRMRLDVPVDGPDAVLPATVTPPATVAAAAAPTAPTTVAEPVEAPAPTTPTTAAEPVEAQRPRRSRFRLSRRPATVIWSVALAAAAAMLGAAIADVGPHLLGGLGAALVGCCYMWGLAGRSGGRPVLFTGLTAAVAAVVLATDDDRLRTGAAVMTAALTAVFAVMATVPAPRFGRAVRETLVATLISVVGGVAVIGWEPVVTVSRFQYAALALALVAVFGFVYRLGAGLHGLGRRGVLVVGVGAVMLAATLLYAEMIRRYGTPGLVGTLEHGVRWSRIHLHGYPRPIEALVGIPALLWGTHMRARRRQGWWVCAFGVALTAPVASTLVNSELGVVTQSVSLGYSLVLGALVGFVVIRLDLMLTPASVPAAAGGGRRAAREAEDATAVRPEPARTQALL